jgi:peptidoglycan LD-endopeptidase CwlK
MASRSLDDLAQPVQSAAQGLLSVCAACGIDLLIYCTLRSNAEQAELYAIGRTKPGKRVTYAKPGDSLHNPDEQGKAWAFDAVPMLSGKPQWGDAALMARVGMLAERAGLEWAGRWSGALKESVHFQMKRGKK